MLILSITNACNFHCKTCIREYPDKIQNIPLDLVEKAIVEYIKLTDNRIVAITGGEPCLHPQFEKIIDIIIKHDCRFAVTTNGFFREKYEFLLEKPRKAFQNIRFSMDGATKEVHDKIRQPGSFERLKKTIKFFSSKGVYTRVAVCVNKLNYHQLEMIPDLAKELGVNNINFFTSIRTSLNSDIVLKDKEKEECRLRIYEIIKNTSFSGIIKNGFYFGFGVEFCQSMNLDSILVNPSGEISFCCNIIRDGAVVGSLKDHFFFELYNRCLDLSCQLKKKRVEMLSKGEIFEGFHNCEFCNIFFKKHTFD
jgi:MoaA/NifB/PqqE/SkfB family radical SAM enzyme